MGGGLASAGMRPVVEIMFPDFALMASDQLFNQIGKLRHMYGGQVSFPLVLRTRVAIGYGYGGQHSMDPAGFFALFSGWRIVAPSNAVRLCRAVQHRHALQRPGADAGARPALRRPRATVPADDLDYCVPYGKANVLREGSDVTVLTYLTGLSRTPAGGRGAGRRGHQRRGDRPAHARLYRAWTMPRIGASVRKTGALLIVEQAPRSLALARAHRRRDAGALLRLSSTRRSAHVTALDVPPPVSRPLEAAVLPDVARVKAAIRALARRA